MSESARISPLPKIDENGDVSAEEERIIRERLATFEQDRKAARPADEVLERLLRRHPTP